MLLLSVPGDHKEVSQIQVSQFLPYSLWRLSRPPTRNPCIPCPFLFEIHLGSCPWGCLYSESDCDSLQAWSDLILKEPGGIMAKDMRLLFSLRKPWSCTHPKCWDSESRVRS